MIKEITLSKYHKIQQKIFDKELEILDKKMEILDNRTKFLDRHPSELKLSDLSAFDGLPISDSK